MNASQHRFSGLRLAAFASLLIVSAGALRAEEKAKPEVPPSVLKKYDKNKDGALDENETARWEADKAERREKDRKTREALLQKYDTDKNGRLSEDEKAAAKLGMEKERTERDMTKGKEKAQERLAREKAEKESVEKEKLARQAAEDAAAQGQAAGAAKSENVSDKARDGDSMDGKTNADEETAGDGMMMTP